MSTSTHLLRTRRFLPLFVTQLFNAFNDNLYKNAMVLFVVYSIYNSESAEAAFSGLASGIFILPFFLFSALAGQLADMRDKARIIRWIKFCEILIMLVGAGGLVMAWKGIAVDDFAIPLLLAALFAMGVHSTFFGPIKYAILPQHLHRNEVLAGTGWVEAGTYIAILGGTILAGWLEVEEAAVGIVLVAVVGWIISLQIPPAPALGGGDEKLDWHILRASVRLVREAMRNAEVRYAILSISFFWAIGTVLFVQFFPLAKNVIVAGKEVASLFLVVFSIGIAIGSVAVNRLLKGRVSALYSPASVVVMGLFVAAFYLICKLWQADQPDSLLTVREFLAWPMASLLLLALLGIAIFGGMFVVPLYAFLTTRVEPDHTSRAIAANNIVNSGAMVGGSLLVMAISAAGVPVTEQLLFTASLCVVSAWLAKKLIAAEIAAGHEP